jgi:alpha-L-arabinofuranosidase
MMASVEFVDITAKTITVSSTINDGKPHKVEGTIVRSNDSELVIHTTGKEGFDVKMQADSFVKVHREVPADISGPHGGVGLGTYGTQAEYSDVEVTGPSGTLLRCDFSQGMKGWKSVNGTWTTENGNLAQTSGSDNCRIITNFPDWTDYTYHLRARKNGGREGFLVLFHVRDDKNYLWWNLGGWKNVRTAFESVTNGTQTVLGENSDVTIDEGRWYDIRLEIKGRNIRAFLDNKLIADVNDNLSPRIVKLVDASIADLKTGIPATATYTGDLVSEVVLKLPDDTGGAPTMVAPSKPDAALP